MINQISLENKVISALNEDNSNHNTFHFVWSEDDECTMLNIISCNSKNGQQFLLLTQGDWEHNKSLAKMNCLEYALDRIKERFPLEYSWKVKWVDTNNVEQVSYFRGANEDAVRSKFYFHDINSAIVEITKQPIS